MKTGTLRNVTTDISVVYGNIRSLCNKIESFNVFLESNNPDIVCLTESWLKEDHTDSHLVKGNNRSYSIFRCDRTCASGGGVAVFVSHKFTSNLIATHRNDSFEVIVIDIYSTKTYRIICVYRKPVYDTVGLSSLTDFLAQYLLCPHPVFVFGDFNLPGINWETKNSLENMGKLFLDFCSSLSLQQTVNFPTRENNFLDICLTPDVHLIRSVNPVAPLQNCDHTWFNVKFESVYEETPELRKVLNYRNADFDSMRRELVSIDWNGVLTCYPDIDNFYNFFVEFVNYLVKTYVPLKTVNDKGHKIPVYIQNLMSQKDRLFKLSENDDRIRTKYNQVTAKLEKVVQKYFANVEKRIVFGDDSNKIFSYINKSISDKKRNNKICLKDEHGNVLSTDSEKANLFGKFFKSHFVEDDGILPPFQQRANETFPLVEFLPENIYKSIVGWKNSKAKMPDNIPMIIYKELAAEIALPLSVIFNRSFLTSKAPNLWRKSEVVPIPKKGSLSDINNFRPVSITCFSSRLYEKFIADAITNYALSNGLIPAEQHGFLKGRSRETAVLTALEHWTKALDIKQLVDVIYFDFSKAFDRVPHCKLIYKLEKLGLPNNIVNWIKDWLLSRSFTVRCGAKVSNEFDVVSGVPQGSVLGPLCFVLYTCDLAELLSDIDVQFKIYADDVEIHKCYKDGKDREILQSAIDLLAEWSNTWQLPLAVQKCVAFYLGHQNPKQDYQCNGQILEKSDVVRDLGFTIDSGLSFKQHVAETCKKARKRLFCMFRSLKTGNRSVLVRCYKVYVRSVLESGSIVFSPYRQLDKLAMEKVQNTATKRIFLRSGRYSFATTPSSASRNLELNLSSLEERRLISDRKWMMKILHGKCCLSANSFYSFSASRTRGARRKILVPYSRTTLRRMSFFVRTAFDALDRGFSSSVDTNA